MKETIESERIYRNEKKLKKQKKTKESKRNYRK